MHDQYPWNRNGERVQIKSQTTHLFKIDNFSLFKKYQNEMVESSFFDLGGHKWKLVAYPNGNKDGKGHVSIFCENQASVNVKLDFEVFVVSQLTPRSHSCGLSLSLYTCICGRCCCVTCARKRGFGTSSRSQRVRTSSLMSLYDFETKGYLIDVTS